MPDDPKSARDGDALAGAGVRSRRSRAGRKPGMVDVAEVAGVSYQTVSRVVNDLPDVHPDTRKRVQAAVEQLGYRRNMAARALKIDRTTTIGIVTDRSPRFGPVGTLIALEGAARDRGYDCRVATVDEPYGTSVPAAIAGMEEVGVDGIIVIAPRLSFAIAVRETMHRVPLEMIAAGAASSPGMFTYSENQELGARMATRHLIDLGHTEIAHLGGSMDWFDGRVRRRGWEAEMRDAGLKLGPYYEGDWSPAWAYRTGQRLVAEGLPTAIVAASDHTALGLYRAFGENGICVPSDISIVGFDDIEGADYFHPPLTTIRQDFPALARRGIELLLGAIDGRSVEVAPIPPKIIVRQSTAPPRPVRLTASRRSTR